MASLQECEKALHELSAILAEAAGRNERSLLRSVICRVADLDVAFAGDLHDGSLHDVRRIAVTDSRGANITLATSSDDLLGLVDGSLGFAGAWASGRLGVHVSITDLLRLRTLL